MAVAGAAVLCGAGAWFLADPAVLRVLVAATAAVALTGAVFMRSWDESAGRQVADLTRARESDQWKTDERIAELESDVDESRELRLKLEGKLRAKRIELAGLRGEHAALLRRYATAETERATALEGRRQLALEAAVEPKALPPAGSTPTASVYLKAAQALDDLAQEAEERRAAAPQLAAGAELPAERGRGTSREEPRGERARATAVQTVGTPAGRSAAAVTSPGEAAGAEAPADAAAVGVTSAHAAGKPAGRTTEGSADRTPEAAAKEKDSAAPAATGTGDGEASEDATGAAGATAGAAGADTAAGTSTTTATGPGETGTREPAGTGSDADAATTDEADEADEADAETSGDSGTETHSRAAGPLAKRVPGASAIVPYSALRRPTRRPGSGFDFFGTQAGAHHKADDAGEARPSSGRSARSGRSGPPQPREQADRDDPAPAGPADVEREDLADVVGEEALAARRRSEDGAVGDVIDLSEPDDGTEPVEAAGVRGATR